MIDIHRLMEAYYTANKKKKRGKRALDHFTRSSILLLVAAWETYIEELLVESVNMICLKIGDPHSLPNPVKKNLTKYVEEHKNELKAFQLSGDKWKIIYVEYAEIMTNQLNTPKKNKVDELFKNFLGVECVSSQWGKSSPDFIVEVRGTIAHKVRSENYLQSKVVEAFIEEIESFVTKTDIAIYHYLTQLLESTPWNNTYTKGYKKKRKN